MESDLGLPREIRSDTIHGKTVASIGHLFLHWVANWIRCSEANSGAHIQTQHQLAQCELDQNQIHSKSEFIQPVEIPRLHIGGIRPSRAVPLSKSRGRQRGGRMESPSDDHILEPKFSVVESSSQSTAMKSPEDEEFITLELENPSSPTGKEMCLSVTDIYDWDICSILSSSIVRIRAHRHR